MARAMQAKLPAKIDIGPVYNVDPQRRKAYSGEGSNRFLACALLQHRQCMPASCSAWSAPGHMVKPQGYCMRGAQDHMELTDSLIDGAAGLGGERMFAPVERELVFDIDLTDYDDVRTCGKEGHICNACWPLMAVAVDVRASSCSGMLAEGLLRCTGSVQWSSMEWLWAVGAVGDNARLSEHRGRRALLDALVGGCQTRLAACARRRCWMAPCGRTLGSSTSCGCSLAAAASTAGSATSGAACALAIALHASCSFVSC